MSLGYILKQVGVKMGLSPAAADQRATLLRFVNEATAELYTQSDMDGSLLEQVWRVNGDQTIAVPAYVGQIRAMREADTMIAWHLNQARPRYNTSNWQDMWRNWRMKGLGPLHTSVRNQSVVTVTVGNVETPPISVTISGSTPTASRINEVLVMDALTKTTTNPYNDIVQFSKDRANNYDVVMTDVDGLELSVIRNDMLEAQYQIIDVSLCPWLNIATGTLDHYLEVLFKRALAWMSEDGDEFLDTSVYDNVIVNKCLQLWAEEQGKAEEALAYDAKATRTLARIHEDANRGAEDVVALVPNPHDSLNPRVRTGTPRRYNPYMCGKYGYY